MEKDLKNKLDKYRQELYLYYYVFAEDIRPLLKSAEQEVKKDRNFLLLTDSFLSDLENLVLNNEEYEFLGDDEKDNIFSILVFLRQNVDEKQKNEKIERYNQIIQNLNSTRGSINAEDYLLSDMETRLLKRTDKINLKYSDPDRIKKIYEYDVNVLNLLTLTTQEQFNEMCLDYTANNYLFHSLLKYTKEFPEMFKDDDVFNKSLILLALNSKRRVYHRTEFLYDNSKMKKILVKTKRSLYD